MLQFIITIFIYDIQSIYFLAILSECNTVSFINIYAFFFSDKNQNLLPLKFHKYASLSSAL